MEIECPYCGTAHLLDLGGHRPAVLIMLHCLMCGGRLSLPDQPEQPTGGYPMDGSASYHVDGGYVPTGSGPVFLEAIRPSDRYQWAPTGAVYDERLGTWAPATGSHQPSPTLRSIIRKSVGLNNWQDMNTILDED